MPSLTVHSAEIGQTINGMVNVLLAMLPLLVAGLIETNDGGPTRQREGWPAGENLRSPRPIAQAVAATHEVSKP